MVVKTKCCYCGAEITKEYNPPDGVLDLSKLDGFSITCTCGVWTMVHMHYRGGRD